MKKILQCLMIIIGTLIGAGFASGQEILSFFNLFLDNGVLGIVLASVLFGIITFCVVKLSNKKSDYRQLVKNHKIFIIIMQLFTVICFCTMLSAIGTFLKEQYHFPFYLGVLLVDSICLLSFLFQLKGLEKINNVLVPVILLGMLVVSCRTNFHSVLTVENKEMHHVFLFNWWQSALLYVGYNSILLVPILMQFYHYQLHKTQMIVLSIFVAVCICITGLLVFFTVHTYYPEIIYTEMPMLLISKGSGRLISLYYGIVILLAIFTTAFSSGYSFLKLHTEKHYFKNCILLCVLGFTMSGIGFSNFVNWFYPLFGYLGFFQMLYIFYAIWKDDCFE